VRLLAKIENLDGVEKLEELIPRCDEIVIARGDLGNAMDLWELPAVQKKIAAACREAGRDFMVATHMLDSMTHRRVPTRAEVSDIFNAVLDGAASVMVTGETAAGEYPADVIRYLYRTAREAERMMQSNPEHAIEIMGTIDRNELNSNAA
jgi:pyruvate kinase